MKANHTKRWVSVLLVLCMAASLFVTPALAVNVTTTPGGTELEVEYFTSTLYKWDEDLANAATMEADRQTGSVLSAHPTVQQVSNGEYYKEDSLSTKVSVKKNTTQQDQYTKDDNVYYADLLDRDSDDLTPTKYYYYDGSTYYRVYVTRTSSWGEHTYKLFAGDNYNEVHRATMYVPSWNSVGVDLYQKEQVETTTYRLMTADQPLEGEKTYSSLNDTVETLLYYRSTATGYEGKGFYFTNAGNKPSDASDVPAYSKWDGETKDQSGTAMQQYSYYSGLAADRLSESTNAPFSNSVNAANLFATDGSNTGYTSVYTNVQVPFVYKDGYYELNSDKNAVYFDGGNAVPGDTMNIADKPAAFKYDLGDGRFQNNAGFQPFNTLRSNNTVNAVLGNKPNGNTAQAYLINDPYNPTYGFGMVTTVDFQMTDDGMIEGQDGQREDIIFEFSGDDDVWVYVDGVLALDIGGTHDAIQGTINFATGDVTVRSEKYDKIRDKNEANKITEPNVDGSTWVDRDSGIVTGSYKQCNIYNKLKTTLTGFASQGNHTLTVYYMDRGRGLTNCQIRFNLPQRDSVSVTKNIDPNYAGYDAPIPDPVMDRLNERQFGFTLYSNGDTVANKSFAIYRGNATDGTSSTDQNGHFTLKNGQTAVFTNLSLDGPEGQTWYVVEDQLDSKSWDDCRWIATTNVSNPTIEASTGFKSQTVTVTGSSTSTDEIEFVCTNSYNYNNDFSVDAVGETIVLDYGLPVLVDVTSNDVVSGDNAAIGRIELVSNELQYGSARVVDNTKIEYTLTEDFCGIEKIEYKVIARDSLSGEDKPSEPTTLTIIPATSVYYEENFSNMIAYQAANATWNPVVTVSETPVYQETGMIGNPDDSTYGTDAAYLNKLGDSNGTSKYVQVGTKAQGSAAQFTYEFTGTGTAIYGRINTDTAYVKLEIKNKDTSDTITKYIDTIVKEDNKYGLDQMYNIPLYVDSSMDYGPYSVRVYIYSKGTPTAQGASGSQFYLDGIRVYNPMGTSVEDNDEYSTASSAYARDDENNTAVLNIRDKLVNDYLGTELEENAFVTLTDLQNDLLTVEDYASVGPKFELYLKGNQYKVSFAVQNWNSGLYRMYLGLKAPDETAAKVKIGDQTYNIGNSADCYYDISEDIDVKQAADGTYIGYIDIEGVKGLVALTNIKVTGEQEFELIPSPDEEVDADGAQVSRLMMMTVSEADALIAGTAVQPGDDSSTDGDVQETPEEPEAFEPDRMKTSCVYSRLLRTATVSVTTSSDVDYVTINGRTVHGVTLFGSRIFTRICTGISKGETIEIVCYNQDGVASQAYTVTAK